MFIHRPMHMCNIWLVTTIEPVMWQLRRQLQESNFGTVRTSPALEYADLRRKDAHIMSETRSCMAVRGESLTKFTSTPCPPGVHLPGARKPNVPHTLGRPCASERSSWGVPLIISCFARRMTRTSVVIITRFRAVRCVGARAGAVAFRY